MSGAGFGAPLFFGPIHMPVVNESTLYQHLAAGVGEWRAEGHPAGDHSALAEILHWAKDPGGSGFKLRAPQLRALETYWHLRLIEGTPHVFDLYKKYFPKSRELRNALGLSDPAIRDFVEDRGMPALWEKIKADDEFVRTHRLEALRETLTLNYPSYILALAMGAGKTALIGAIIATEFALALEHSDGPFVENALVFAPGKTILESLRELVSIPYDRILPPRLYKPFAASVRFVFTRDGEKDIPVIRGSSFNVVVTNTEKIRIQKETIRKGDIGKLFAHKADEAAAEIANLRLQAIASLPKLAVFSDEAHHTYGQGLDRDLKKVRKTVDYLAENTDVVCVVNTTGTPYFQRQPLRDVVVWYGLSEGIRDGILKEVSGSIHAFTFDDANADKFVTHIVEDFFKDYGNVTLPNGAPAKLAIYFPQTDDLEELRPKIEAKLAALGHSPTLVLRNTNESPKEEVDAFNRLNDPDAPHRIILLVNKGTEGWNCPSLFACALARRLRSSNNFVLQAACRCLRQVPGNKAKARIYLSMDNRNTLDRELQETYGESITELDHTQSRSRAETIQLRKVPVPPLCVRRKVRTVVAKNGPPITLALQKPSTNGVARLQDVTYKLAESSAGGSVLKPTKATEINVAADTMDLYTAAVELASVYRLDLWTVYDELKRLYDGAVELPFVHLLELAQQIEEQPRRYEVREETVEVALALVNLAGFKKELGPDGTETYTAEITFPVDRQHLLLAWEDFKNRCKEDVGFHYTPYNFDSRPERSFFEQLLDTLDQDPKDIDDIYFTGALTDPNKTDFYVEYRGEDGNMHRYTPDFIIRRKDGKCLIVEIKSAQFQAATEEDLARAERGEAVITVEGRKAVALKSWEHLNPDRLKYHIIFAAADTLGIDQMQKTYRIIQEQ